MYVHAKQNYDSENFSRGNANYAHFAALQKWHPSLTALMRVNNYFRQ